MFLQTLLLVLSTPAAHAQGLMPLPVAMTPASGTLLVTGTFQVSFKRPPGRRLRAAAGRLTSYLSRATGIPIRPSVVALTVDCAGEGDDESYVLDVTPSGATLSASSVVGALRGFATFAQLVELGPQGFGARAVHIEDQPRFPYRGLLLDASRHWMPVAVVKRTLDAMEFVKLNVFHWHLSDDQGFRVESKRYPKLHELGSDRRYYTQAQIREIIAYAADRGIRVIPEFDMPGHSTSWFVGYPELASAPGPYQIERGWGIKDPCIDPTREEVYTFLDGFIGEMAGLFTDPYFHIGGDEVNGKHWKANAAIQQFMQQHGMKDQHDLQAYFNQRILKILQKYNKKMIGWEEILHPSLPRDIVVHSWRGQKSLAQAATQGYQGILSSGWYIDLYQHASQHYAVDPIARETANLNPAERQRVLGGEATMWAEYVTPENVDNRIWPRTAAIAERLWSPATVTGVNSMYERMEAVSRKLDWLGLRHRLGFTQMVERLAGGHDPGPVRTLAELVEPVKGYARGRAQKYTSFTPLNRMVDAANSESETARRFGLLADEFLATKRANQTLRAMLIEWHDNDAKLRPIIRDSALLAEVAPISQDLAALAAAALEAVEMIASGQRASAVWAARQKTLLDAAAKPRAELLLSPLDALRKLIQAAQ